jgi:hypothetical protein
MIRITLLLGSVLLVACGDNRSNVNEDGVDAGDRPDGSTLPIDTAPITADAPPDGPPVISALNANGGFETGDTSNWICNGNASCSMVTANTHSGAYAASAVNLPNDYSGFRVNILPLVCPTDTTCATGTTFLGKTLRFHGFIKPIGTASAVRFVLRWNCPSAAMGGYEWLQNIDNPAADTWNEYDREFVIPDCDYANSNENLYLYTGTVGTTEFHIDDLEITDVTPP